MTDTDERPDADATFQALNLLPNGMVRLNLDEDGEVMLRRPKIGELRALMESLAEHNDAILAHSHRMQARQEEYRAEWSRLDDEGWEPDADTVEERIEQREERHARVAELRRLDREAGRASERFSDEQAYDWLREVVDTLGIGDPLPDDPPGWLASPQLPHRLTNHWRTVPSAPGS